MSQSLAGKTVSDGFARTGRTLGQGITFGAVLQLLTEFGLVQLTPGQTTALMPFGIATFSWLQTRIENWAGRAFMRELPPRPADVPLVGEEPKPRRRRRERPPA